jgi:hypothetical protein
MSDNAVLDFPVLREGLYRSDGKYTGRDVIWRPDTGADLGYVGHEYQLVEHKRVVEFVDRVLGTIGTKTKAESVIWNDGAKMKTTIRFPEWRFKPNGDEFDPTLNVFNSYDAKSALKWRFGWWRKICSNGAVAFKIAAGMRYIHKFENVDLKQIGEKVVENLAKLVEEGKLLYAKLVNEDFNPYLTAFLAEAYVTDRYKNMVLEKATEDYGLVVERNEDGEIERVTATQGFSAYDLWNVCTFIATHRARAGTVTEKMNNAIANVFTR